MITYSRGADGTTMPGNDVRLKEQLEWLKLIPDGIRTILDVGAGAGSHSRYFKDIGLQPTALDIDPSNFRYADEIEFIEGDLGSLAADRKFDAVFCSHVVEHFPNLQAGLLKMRELLRPDGLLIVAVPPYEPVVSDEHWQAGWHCAQLAMLLVSTGFDCSESTFQEIGYNVCGWGRKSDIPEGNFEIARCRNYLPLSMRDRIFFAPSGNPHIPELIFADRVKTRVRRRQMSVGLPQLKMEDGRELLFTHEPSQQDIVASFPDGLDLTTKPLRLVAICEGGAVPLRVAVDSSVADDFDECSEFYFGRTDAGAILLEFYPHDFRAVSRPADFASIRRIFVGGVGEKARVKVWLYDGEMSLLAQSSCSSAAIEPPPASKMFFAASGAQELVFKPAGVRGDIEIRFSEPLNITEAPLEIAVLCEGEQVPLRIAVDSSEHGDFADCSEYYLDNVVGLTAVKIKADEFRSVRGSADLSCIRRAVVGGAGENARATIWLQHKGKSLYHPTGG